MPRAKAYKNIEELRSMARSHTATMLNVLVGIARQKSAPAGARAVAAGMVLERGWGKATQEIATKSEITVVIRKLCDDAEPLTIEHNPRAISDQT